MNCLKRDEFVSSRYSSQSFVDEMFTICCPARQAGFLLPRCQCRRPLKRLCQFPMPLRRGVDVQIDCSHSDASLSQPDSDFLGVHITDIFTFAVYGGVDFVPQLPHHIDDLFHLFHIARIERRVDVYMSRRQTQFAATLCLPIESSHP